MLVRSVAVRLAAGLGEDFGQRDRPIELSARFRPITARAAEVWALLRQISSVAIEGLQLAGTTTNRRMVMDVTVDGAGGEALGVMSQGEIHALALSLFLPRVLLPESPFGFVVIDDPVQAMDPGRIDGLTRVLAKVAKTRQVIVIHTR